MERTNISLERRQTETFGLVARDEEVSRAEIIRRVLDRGPGGVDDDLAADLAAIDDSFGALQDADVPDRGPGDREDHLTRMWHEA